jgi:HlyD family secretion protein
MRADDMNFSGTLEMTEHSLGAPEAGRLEKLFVDEGDEVKKGARIATLERYEQAKRDFDRAQSLLQQGGATKQSVELAALALSDQQVVSPVDGVVITKIREEGEVLAAGAPVVTVGDRSDIWVRVYVPEGVINRIAMGQEASVRFDGVDQEFKGRVTFVAPKAEFTPRNVQTTEERVTQTFAVKVRVEKPEQFLRPGVSADVIFGAGRE